MRFRLVLAFTLIAVAARADFREFKLIPVDPALETKVRHAAEASLKQFPNLKPEDLGISMVELTNPTTLGRGDYHGDAPFYPASVIKIFFMTDLFLKNKFDLPDVPRATREMIGVSDNDATAYIVDILASTDPGPNLEGRALERFIAQRRSINDDFTRLGYDISAMCKPWSFGPYGRDLQVLGKNRQYRNRLTANATTSLITWIARRHAPESDLMLNFLSRPINPTRPDENQVKEFAGEALAAGAKLWSKAGWTSEVRHDTAYVEFPDGRKFVLSIFTRGQASDVTLLGAIARNVFTEIGEPVAPPPPPPAQPPAK
ncbi:MAG TPA: serine hydrolase [Thermoanaerobaculia bacterium]|nr:serine hydrolase [Thermoanaerobaculia bacterium]